jgi:hypothetical protein
MNENMDIENLVDTLRSERYEWNKLIEAVGEVRMQLPGVVGGWSVKDLVAHISWAERETLLILNNRMSEGSELWYLDQEQRNERIYQQNRERPLPEVLTEAHNGFEELITGIEGLKEEALYDPGYFKEMRQPIGSPGR